MLFFKISAKSYCFTLSDESKNIEDDFIMGIYIQFMLERHDRQGCLNPTLRVVFRVMHGEQQRQRRAHRLFATATQTAVLHLTPEQFPNDRLARGTERTEPETHKEMTSSPGLLMLNLRVCFRLLPTCCWLLCRPEGLPVPVSLGGVGPG